MSLYIVSQIVKKMLTKGVQPLGAKALILGLAFKENCPDLRNTKVTDIADELESYGASVDICDPWVSHEEAREEYGIDLVAEPEKGAYDIVVAAVAHDQFKAMGADGMRALGKPTSVVYDIKYVLPAEASDDRL
jgi:UDP-N-acetyl-D-galactosamine dehydrogenase